MFILIRSSQRLNSIGLVLIINWLLISWYQVFCDKDARRLLEDLLENYDSIVRPVIDPNEQIKLSLGIKLSQIADIDERNQIMTTNVWVRHEWSDYKLTWVPKFYGNITKIKVPSSKIWLPDVTLYNNADGDYQITTQTKVTIHYDGRIIWEPPMIYKSYCAINIEYYPFDIQDCYMKFGTWTFDGNLIDLEHVNLDNAILETKPTINKGGISTKLYTVDQGIDMSDYYQSVEWDVLSIPAQKNIKYYDCCVEPYYDIYFNITIRRKTLFYTVNLIIPCVNISFLSVLVFYLPSSSGEKIALGIYVLVALLVFYLLLIELIPPTSLVIPLLGKYLLFTLVLVNLSILLTIFILNLHHRRPNTHVMPKWVKAIFIGILPKILMIERPKYNPEENFYKNLFITDQKNSFHLRQINKQEIDSQSKSINLNKVSRKSETFETSNNSSRDSLKKDVMNSNISTYSKYPLSIQRALLGINYIHSRIQKDNIDRLDCDDWKYVAMVIDRLLLWIFSISFFVGTFGILLKAPSIYDERKPLGK